MRRKNILRLTGVLLALMAATTAAAGIVLAEGKPGQAEIRNQAPSVISVEVVTDDDPGTTGTQINPVPGSTKSVLLSLTASDPNGHNDLVSTTVSVTAPDGSPLTPSSAFSLVSGTGARGVFEVNFDLPYYWAPGGGYLLSATVTDAAGATGSSSGAPAEFSVAEAIGLSLNTSTIDFGVTDPGQTSSAASVVGENKGNVTIDVVLSGTPLVFGSNSIAIEKVDSASDSAFTSPTALSGTGQTLTDYNLAPGLGSTRQVYFQLRTPSGEEQYLPAGTYVGTINVVATGS